MFKVGIIGSQGSGKTTAVYQLVSDLKKRGIDALAINESARSCPFPIGKKSIDKTHFWILGDILQKEHTSKCEVMVTDRTLLDAFSYAEYFDPDFFSSLKPFVQSYMQTYNMILFLKPNNKQLVKDGFRSGDLTFRDETHSFLKRNLESMEIDYREMSSKDISLLASYVESEMRKNNES